MSFGAPGAASGEVVFNTAHCGYQEVLTDPSYTEQIVVMTVPHVGNYGVTDEDLESKRPRVAGFVVREASRVASSWRATARIQEYLVDAGVVAISELDTRALTRHLRAVGAKRGVIGPATEASELIERARAAPSMQGRDLVGGVTCDEPYVWPARETPEPLRVVAYDFGIKRNILRMLVRAGCEVHVVPATTTAGDALALGPDGILLSNGPGDPEPVGYVVETIRELVEKRPIFGICLGLQLLGLALGGRTFKLKFGHHGANHPVKNLVTGRVEVTSQNHGFGLDASLFEKPGLECTHVSLNDDTIEGFRHRELPLMAVQYHPEASPGPHDSHYLFDDFVEMMRAHRNR